VSAALRALAASGARLGVFTDAPEPLARVALAHLGAARRVEALETGLGARERLLEQLGPDATVVSTQEELVKISRSGP
jgi:phosphoglycolate phosphatase-like HAD superfamily hydrolase